MVFPIFITLCIFPAIISGTALSHLVKKRQSPTGVCKPQAFYCGHELSNMGYSNTNDHSVYHCGDEENGHFSMECEGGCVVGANAQIEQAYCQCKIGSAYCGYELKLGNFLWAGTDDHTLYRCSRTSYVDVVQKCDKGCVYVNQGDSYCRTSDTDKPCSSGNKYCGYELQWMGLWSGADPHDLYTCDGNSASNAGHCTDGCVQNLKADSYCDQGKMAIRPN